MCALPNEASYVHGTDGVIPHERDAQLIQDSVDAFCSSVLAESMTEAQRMNFLREKFDSISKQACKSARDTERFAMCMEIGAPGTGLTASSVPYELASALRLKAPRERNKSRPTNGDIAQRSSLRFHEKSSKSLNLVEPQPKPSPAMVKRAIPKCCTICRERLKVDDSSHRAGKRCPCHETQWRWPTWESALESLMSICSHLDGNISILPTVQSAAINVLVKDLKIFTAFKAAHGREVIEAAIDWQVLLATRCTWMTWNEFESYLTSAVGKLDSSMTMCGEVHAIQVCKANNGIKALDGVFAAGEIEQRYAQWSKRIKRFIERQQMDDERKLYNFELFPAILIR